MMRLLAMLFVVSAVRVGYAEDVPSDVDHALEELGRVKYSHQYHKAYRKLFAAAGQEGVPRLLKSEDDSIALQAAWEMVELSVPVEMGKETYRPTASQLAEFLRLFQERTGVRPPGWWMKAVLDARANRRYNTYPGNSHPSLAKRIQRKNTNWPASTPLEFETARYWFRQGKNQIAIPDSLLEKTAEGRIYPPKPYTGTFTKSRCFLTAPNDWGYSHPVVCLDRESGETLWKAEACGCFWGSGCGLSFSGVTVFVPDEERVYVFGAAGGLYAHGFRASDGKTLVRFSSGY